MAGGRQEQSFWISYADLSTGLMMVFLLIMVVLVFAITREHRQNEEQRENRDEEIRNVVEQISIILGTKQKLAEATKKALGDRFVVDPVTAQLRIDEDLLSFGRSGDTQLSKTALNHLADFGPPYICGLWAHEHARCVAEKGGAAGCERLDPEAARGVKRILITGNADLEALKLEANLATSAQRASVVHRALSDILRRCARNGGECFVENPRLPPTCAASSELVWNYAQERLLALGAGHVRHCRSASAALLGACESARSLIEGRENRKSKAFRTVTFELELTNADLTGLLVELAELEGAMGQEEPSLVQTMRETAQRCWSTDPTEGPSLYAACQDYAIECRGLDDPEAPERAWYGCDGFEAMCAASPERAVCQG